MSTSKEIGFGNGFLVFAALAVAALLTTACTGPSAVTRLPAPDPQLLESGVLQLASDCRPRTGEVYRAEFDVQPDGRVGNIRTTGSTACANEALARWVASFRYNTRESPIGTAVDWMLVEAPRGS
jgi:hypothetical protein